jgi:pilus assembly protein CpaB
MNLKALIPLIAGLVVGGIALKLGADVLRKARGAQQVDMVEVWTAAQDVNRGQRIEEPQLTPLRFPAKLVPEWAFTDKDELVGRVAKNTTFAGEIFHVAGLMPPGTRPGLPVPEGVRAVAVKIDESSGVDYHLEPGSRVDVVASFQVRENNRQQTIARTVLENVEVAAVGQRTTAVTQTEEDGSPTTDVRKVRAVTLFVPPDKVPTLLLAENRGRIKLSMRSDGGDVEAGTLSQDKAIDESSLFGKPKPEKENAFANQVGGLFGNLFGNQPEPTVTHVPAPEPEPEPEPAAPPEPKFVHVMVVRSGDTLTRLAWTHFDTEPIEISAADYRAFVGAPAAEGPRNTATTPKPAATPSGTTPPATDFSASTPNTAIAAAPRIAPPAPAGPDAAGIDPQPEPEELPE